MQLLPSDLLKKIATAITVYDKSEAESIAYILMEHFWNISRSDALLNQRAAEVNEEELSSLIKRINTAEPVQYITGETWFYDRKFKVNKHVLIPRFETEELVHLIINEYKEKQNLRLLDACTGSGCIAISLGAELNNSQAFAVDISNEALQTAWSNAELNNAPVTFIQNNLLEPDLGKLPDNLDIFVSNPPYVKESEKKLMHSNVLDYEPHLALFVEDENPLIFYKALTKLATNLLKPGGKIYFEINEQLGKETAEVLRSFDFQNIRVIKDLNGKDRIVAGEKNN
ncbi:peptide chain release factor N(5)-glutamine methyltransferase [Sporocytophaga myxococcoides]|uniref:peptide chain release factor N(5)-glutamine methyltransferase n=1 Tax=Sporocytophaga myxococcoides TaxID=153721 RepID=UPI001FE052E8|nr:peptide chain release factor N(5)-glutamine methyltransferase [Sporocytophaga myxococcoides]